MPSGDSTPRASGFDSRCSPRSWLTSGGPSSRRFVVYQKVSGKPALLSSRPVALRVATDDCAFHPVYTLLGALETSYHYNRCGRYTQAAVPARRGLPGRGLPHLVPVHPRQRDLPGRHGPRLIGKRFVIPIEEAFP